jgi:hypothetical protein
MIGANGLLWFLPFDNAGRLGCIYMFKMSVYRYGMRSHECPINPQIPSRSWWFFIAFLEKIMVNKVKEIIERVTGRKALEGLGPRPFRLPWLKLVLAVAALTPLTIWLAHWYWEQRFRFQVWIALADLLVMLLRFPGELLFESSRATYWPDRIYSRRILGSEILLAFVAWFAALWLFFWWRKHRAPATLFKKPLPRWGLVWRTVLIFAAVFFGYRVLCAFGISALSKARAAYGLPLQTFSLADVGIPDDKNTGLLPMPELSAINIQEWMLIPSHIKRPVLVPGGMHIKQLPPGLSENDAHAAELLALKLINSRLEQLFGHWDAFGWLFLDPDGKRARYCIEIEYYHWGPLAAAGQYWCVELHRVGGQWMITASGESEWLS